MPDPSDERSFVRRHAGSFVLVGTGWLLLAYSMAVHAWKGGNASVGFATLGILSVLVGAGLPRLLEAEVGPQGGKVKLAPLDEQRESLGLGVSDEVHEQQVDEPGEIVVASRHTLAALGLHGVLHPDDTSPTAGCELQLYLYDSIMERLVPALVEDQPPGQDESWEVGKGATGRAYQQGEVVSAVGNYVWDATYGLTPEQSERYRSYTAVMAVPVMNAAEEVIGVLTALTDAPNGGQLVTDDGRTDLVTRSLLIARALVDLLRWFADG